MHFSNGPFILLYRRCTVVDSGYLGASAPGETSDPVRDRRPRAARKPWRRRVRERRESVACAGAKERRKENGRESCRRQPMRAGARATGIAAVAAVTSPSVGWFHGLAAHPIGSPQSTPHRLTDDDTDTDTAKPWALRARLARALTYIPRL